MPSTYRQSDSRWGNKKVGFGTGNQTIANVGCVLLDITYLYNLITNQDLTPDVINDRLKKQKAFVGADVLWARVPLALPELKFVARDRNYSNPIVWAWINISPRMPVLVEVYKASSPTRKHWTLFLGNQKMYDPIKGAIISTGTAGYTPATGSARFARS